MNKINYCLLKRHCEVISSNLEPVCLNKQHFQLFNAKISVGNHVKNSVFSSFFNKITFYSTVRCRTFQEINAQNFTSKFQMVAEETAENFQDYFIFPHPVHP